MLISWAWTSATFVFLLCIHCWTTTFQLICLLLCLYWLVSIVSWWLLTTWIIKEPLLLLFVEGVLSILLTFKDILNRFLILWLNERIWSNCRCLKVNICLLLLLLLLQWCSCWIYFELVLFWLLLLFIYLLLLLLWLLFVLFCQFEWLALIFKPFCNWRQSVATSIWFLIWCDQLRRVWRIILIILLDLSIVFLNIGEICLIE